MRTAPMRSQANPNPMLAKPRPASALADARKARPRRWPMRGPGRRAGGACACERCSLSGKQGAHDLVEIPTGLEIGRVILHQRSSCAVLCCAVLCCAALRFAALRCAALVLWTGPQRNILQRSAARCAACVQNLRTLHTRSLIWCIAFASCRASQNRPAPPRSNMLHSVATCCMASQHVAWRRNMLHSVATCCMASRRSRCIAFACPARALRVHCAARREGGRCACSEGVSVRAA
jgi:hypothetical protein